MRDEDAATEDAVADEDAEAGPDVDRTAAVRRYYDAIDGDDYDALRDLLADDFVQRRPDRTIEGADEFVRFMREERPLTDTDHVVETVFVAPDALEAAARGRLVAADGDDLLAFADAFAFDDDGRISSLRTYTNR